MEPPHCWLSSTSSQIPSALHAHHALPVFSVIEWNAAIFDEGNHSLLRLDLGAEHTAVNILRGG